MKKTKETKLEQAELLSSNQNADKQKLLKEFQTESYKKFIKDYEDGKFKSKDFAGQIKINLILKLFPIDVCKNNCKESEDRLF